MKRVLLLTIASALAAQQPPAFEVASIKPNTSGRTFMRGGRTIEIENFSLRNLIRNAYRVPDYALSGPAWLDSANFDIVAKLPADAKPDQSQQMMQSLLADRFKLVVHRENREMSGLALVVDKKGLRLQPVEPGASGSGTGRGMVGLSKGTMTDFANALQNALQRPVKDMTGVAGVYDIKIRWLPDTEPLPADTTGMSGSVYEAVEDLGLKLQNQKLPVEILVVDHVERMPTAN